MSVEIATVEDVERIVAEALAKLPAASVSVQHFAVPLWGSADDVGIYFYGVNRPKLRRWVRAGWVRCAKDGESLQARASYCLADVERVVEAIADGRKPRKAGTGKPRRKSKAAEAAS